MKLRYEYKVFGLEVLLIAVLSVIIFLVSPSQSLNDYVNIPGLATSLVALNSGITIAIFLALFHSDDKNVENFRKFKTASKQAYKIFLVNAVLVCLSTAVIQEELNSQIALNLGLAGLTVAIIGTFVNIWHIFDLVGIMFRR